MNKFLIVFVLLTISTRLFAATNDVISTSTVNTISQNTQDISSVANSARDWGLTDNEWKKYKSLMEGANGRYYPTLTPPEVLGINATALNELMHFAELHAKQEHDKIEKELRFNVAFHEAAKRLYANEPIIRPFDLTPYAPTKQ
jgi:integrating conjugative element protein (TIGR03759 family)